MVFTFVAGKQYKNDDYGKKKFNVPTVPSHNFMLDQLWRE